MELKRWVIVGAGAIGGLLGGKLSMAGKDVTLVARGDHLKAMEQQGGLELIMPNGTKELCGNVCLAEKLDGLGKFDVVVLAVKSHQIEPIAHLIEPICHENTIIMPVQNGLPWWYFFKEGGKFEGSQLKSVDPNGVLWNTIKKERIIGSIAFPAAEIVRPGAIAWVEGRAFPLGEPDRENPITKRVTAVSKCLEEAGFVAPVKKEFRDEIWLKLLGNLCFNPISALSHATISEIINLPETYQLCIDCMKEASRVAEKLGCTIRVTPKRRIERAKQVAGGHKTSMLQDLERKKPIEVDIISSVVEVASLTETPIPSIKALCSCLLLLNQVITTSKL